MEDAVTREWFASAPPCSARVPCGPGTHTIRWEAGRIGLSSHPDHEAEGVLRALGGQEARCLEIAEAWARRADDLTVLAIGPRGLEDRITVTWETVSAAASAHPLSAFGRASRRLRGAGSAELELEKRQTSDLLSLLALGTAFSYRLAGNVAMAHASRPRSAQALTSATEGRVCLAAREWIGIDPWEVRVMLSDGGDCAELTGKGELLIRLPPGWLASVWACGLSLVDKYLVVGVPEPGWPDARVLALRAPGREPVPLDVHGTVSAEGVARWETRAEQKGAGVG